MDDSARGLRVEFYVCLLRIAIDRYVRTGELNDVSDSLARLLEVEIASKLGSVLPIADDFRRYFCYTREVNDLLRSYEVSLRLIFDALAEASHVRKGHVSLDTWLAFLRGALIIGIDVSDREAILCFGWSRMVVHDNLSVGGKTKESCLPFEGFLEALCRISTHKALPTHEEIDAAGEPDAGTFLISLRENAVDMYNAFLEDPKNRIEWGEDPRNPIEPVHMRVEHFIHLVIRTVEGYSGGGGESNMIVSDKEMKKWCNDNLKATK